MTTAQLINQLQNWQAIHGVCNVYYQVVAMTTEEHPILGCAVGENEDGSCDVILFTNHEGQHGQAEQEGNVQY